MRPGVLKTDALSIHNVMCGYVSNSKFHVPYEKNIDISSPMTLSL